MKTRSLQLKRACRAALIALLMLVAGVTNAQIGVGVEFYYQGCLYEVNADNTLTLTRGLYNEPLPPGLNYIDNNGVPITSNWIQGYSSFMREIEGRSYYIIPDEITCSETSYPVTYPVTKIDNEAFDPDDPGNYTVRLGKNIKEIGRLFYSESMKGCDIDWGESQVTTISREFFMEGYQGTSITIPNSVTSFGICAFHNSPNLETVTIGTGLDLLEYASFRQCPKLETIELLGDTDINVYLFAEVDSKTTNIILHGKTTITKRGGGESPSTTFPTGITFELRDGAELVIEDGIDFYSTSPLSVTMQKSIIGHGAKTGGGWNFIATPTAAGTVPSIANNILSSTSSDYDLYYYDEPAFYWRNYKEGDGAIDPGFSLVNGQGYLYSNTSDVTLEFAGTSIASNAQVSVPLSYACSLADLKGFNLVGNPFIHKLTTESNTIKLGETTFSTYYKISGSNIVATTLSATPIDPCTGFMVQATGAGQNLVFNASAKDATSTEKNRLH